MSLVPLGRNCLELGDRVSLILMSGQKDFREGMKALKSSQKTTRKTCINRIPTKKNAVPSPQTKDLSSLHRCMADAPHAKSIGIEGCEGMSCVSQLAGDKTVHQETRL